MAERRIWPSRRRTFAVPLAADRDNSPGQAEFTQTGRAPCWSAGGERCRNRPPGPTSSPMRPCRTSLTIAASARRWPCSGTATARTTASGCGTTTTRGIKPQVSGGRLFALRSGVLTPTTCIPAGCCGRRKPIASSATPRWRTASMWPACNRCVVLDPATGRPLRTHRFEVEPGRPAYVTSIRVGDDVIVIAAAEEIARRMGHLLGRRGRGRLGSRRAAGRSGSARPRSASTTMPWPSADGAVFCDRVALAASRPRSAEAAGEQPAAAALDDLRPGCPLGRKSAGRPPPHRTGTGRTPAEFTETASGIGTRDDWLGYCRELGILLAGKSSRDLRLRRPRRQAVLAQAHRRPPIILCGENSSTSGASPSTRGPASPLGPTVSKLAAAIMPWPTST